MARVLRFCCPMIVNSLNATRLFSASDVYIQSFRPRTLLVRHYAKRKWARTPIKVIEPGQEEEDEASWEDHTRKDGNNTLLPHYTKLREDSNVFTKLMTIAKSRNLRERKSKIVLEGKRLIQDAINAGVSLDSIFFSQEENLQSLTLPTSNPVQIYKITYKQLCLWSNLATPPGIIGVFNLPESRESIATSGQSLPLTVICDNVRDPGNLGAILRCAAAVGCKQILLTKGCVDIWDQKVLRAASGAHFRAAIENNIEWDKVCNYVSQDAAVYLASKGIHESHDDGYYDLDESFGGPSAYEVSPDGSKLQTLDAVRNPRVDTTLYHDVNYGHDKDIVVIVGGETEGVSQDAVKFTQVRYGRSIFIPMKNDIESLNSGVALGVILFEIQRQLRGAAVSEQAHLF